MATQAEKAKAFRALHERKQAFIIPNPWDIGTARMLAHLGFEALATTSMGFALSIGKQDNAAGRDAVMAHASALTSATDLPISADLENGFGDAPETAAETIRLAAKAGLVGGSIEDATGHGDNPIYELAQAVERVRAAVEAARSLPFHFTLTARARELSARTCRPERHHSQAAGLSGGRRGCFVCTWPDNESRDHRSSAISGSPCECAHGIERRELDAPGIIGDGSAARERG